jgi:hypothetical protein
MDLVPLIEISVRWDHLSGDMDASEGRTDVVAESNLAHAYENSGVLRVSA